MLNLGRWRQAQEASARSLTELVPWLLLAEEQVVLDKDGALLAVYAIDGREREGCTAQEMGRITEGVERALRACDARTVLWWTVDRRPVRDYPTGKFSSAVGAHIDAQWRQSFAQAPLYANRHYLSVLWTPPGGADGLLSQFSRIGTLQRRAGALGWLGALRAALSSTRAMDRTGREWAAQLRAFKARLQALEEGLGEVGLRRLGGEALLGFLHARVSPCSEDQPLNRPRAGYLDSTLPDSTLRVESDLLHFGVDPGTYVSATSVKDWPEATFPGLLEPLLGIAGALTVSQCFRFVPREAAQAYIRDVERYNRNLQRTLFSYLREALTQAESELRDPGRGQLADDAAGALGSVSATGRVFGYYNLTVLSWGATRGQCAALSAQVASCLRARGYLVVRESLHLLCAWAGTLPGQWALLARWFFIHNANLADLATVWTQDTGPASNLHLSAQQGRQVPVTALLRTEGDTAMRFSFHQGDLGHCMVVGPSGTGKSVLVNFLIAQFRRYDPCVVFIFDKDFGSRIPTLLQGGRHLDLGGGATAALRLNPLTLLGDAQARPWLQSFLESLLGARGHRLDAGGELVLARALEALSRLPVQEHRLRSLLPFLGPGLAAELAPWVGEGPSAHLFDSVEDELDLADFTCLELGVLLRQPRLAAPVLDYVFERVEQRLDGRPGLIYVEEAWLTLQEPRLARRVDDWLRTLRKRNALVILATQSLEDLARSDIFAALVDNIPNRIFLPNANAGLQAALYQGRFGLNENQISRIATGVGKGNYYFVTPGRSRLVHARFPPAILACLRSDPRAQALFESYPREPGWELGFVAELAGEGA